MNRTLLLCAAAAASLTLAACNKNQAGNATPATPETTASTNTGVGQSEPINKAQDTLAAGVGATSAATMGSHDTGAFASNAAQSDMYEIQAARIAEQKAKSPDVKKFAQEMVSDHTKLSNEMKPLITKAGQTPPADLDQRRKGMLDNLKATPAADFDKAYMDQQVAAHSEALTLMKGYADNGSDPGLKAAAAKAVPTIQKHADLAKQIQSKLAGGAGSAPGR